jgi:hypothetical protein
MREMHSDIILIGIFGVIPVFGVKEYGHTVAHNSTVTRVEVPRGLPFAWGRYGCL